MKKITKRLTSLILSSAMGLSLFQSSVLTYAQAEKNVPSDTAPVGYSLDNGDIRQQVSHADSTDSITADYPIVGASATFNQTGTGYIYDMLHSDEEREFYNRLLEACTIVSESDGDFECTPYAKYSDLSISTTEAQELAWIFHYDNPQFFWMDSHYWYGSYGLQFELYDCYRDGAARAEAQAQFDASAQEYIRGAMQYDTERERSYYLFEALQSNIVYGSNDLDQSAASALIDGVTVCAGFTKSYQMLCEAVGVEAVAMVSENHGWNAIRLSGEWYLVDVTYGIYGLTTEEMHDRDVANNDYHTMTITYSDGTEETFSFYAHDISNRTYPTYHSEFPACTTPLTDASGAGSATTNAAGAVTTTTTSTTITTTEPPISDTGDVDGDGMITLSDASIALSIYASLSSGITLDSYSEEALLAADVNSDGTVSIDDATSILTYYAHLSAGLSADWNEIIG